MADDDDLPGEGRADLLSTYRHLRLAMVMLLGLLLTAVALRVATIDGHCFEGSLSAYYFTSVRAVFVASLCALGACLVVYRGNADSEDIALNAAGALTFIVAFVPTTPPPEGDVTCSASNVPSPGQLDAAVSNNVVAYLIVAGAALVLAAVLVARSTRLGPWPMRALAVFGVALAATAAAFATWPEGFRDHAHTTAAILMFLGMLSVVVLNAVGAERVRRGDAPVGYRNAYIAIAVTMLASAVVLGLLHHVVKSWRHGVLVIEATLLVEFLVFWLVQTRELWNVTRREELPAAI